jgi:hypothetical protein
LNGLNNYDLKNLYFSSIIIINRRMGWAGEKRNAYKIFLGKSDGNRLLGRPGRRWGDNIKMNFKEIGREGGFMCLRM